MNLADNGRDPVAGFREHNNDMSGSIQGGWVGGNINHLSYYNLPMKLYAPWS